MMIRLYSDGGQVKEEPVAFPLSLSRPAWSDEEIDRYERQNEWRSREAAFRTCGIGERYFGAGFRVPEWGAGLDGLYNGPVKDVLSCAKSGGYVNFILTGPPGTGKTWTAAAMLRQMFHSPRPERLPGVREFWDGRYVTSAMLCAMFHYAEGFSPSADYGEVLARCAGGNLLVVDECGLGGPTEGKVLLDVINARYERKRPLMLVGNCTWDELIGMLGRHAASRLAESQAVFDTSGIPDLRRRIV